MDSTTHGGAATSGGNAEGAARADLLDCFLHPWVTRKEVVVDHALGPDVPEVVRIETEVGALAVSHPQLHVELPDTANALPGRERAR